MWIKDEYGQLINLDKVLLFKYGYEVPTRIEGTWIRDLPPYEHPFYVVDKDVPFGKRAYEVKKLYLRFYLGGNEYRFYTYPLSESFKFKKCLRIVKDYFTKVEQKAIEV